MTLVESIIAEHANRERVSSGELVDVTIDRIYLQDGNTPTVERLYREYGFDQVFDPQSIGVFFDHATLSPEARMTDRLREAERFAERFGLRTYRCGTGISHIQALEEGWFKPGNIVLGADSHTCTGGVLQSLALGMGASDIVAAMVTGRTWLRVPETVWINVLGEPHAITSSKDVMLYALAHFGQREFLYSSIEWNGTWIEALSLDHASTIANLGVELGCKCSFLPPSKGRPAGMRAITPPKMDNCKIFALDINGLPPFVARPHNPANAVPIDQCAGERIDYVFIGSCANSYLEDIAIVANVLAGAHVNPRVHCVVTPGSQSIYLQLLRKGLLEILVQAGALVTPPGCGACVGTQGTIPASSDHVLSTMNRNFRGRMGNPDAAIWLASPYVAAHTAILGRIPTMEDIS